MAWNKDKKYILRSETKLGIITLKRQGKFKRSFNKQRTGKKCYWYPSKFDISNEWVGAETRHLIWHKQACWGLCVGIAIQVIPKIYRIVFQAGACQWSAHGHSTFINEVLIIKFRAKRILTSFLNAQINERSFIILTDMFWDRLSYYQEGSPPPPPNLTPELN